MHVSHLVLQVEEVDDVEAGARFARRVKNFAGRGFGKVDGAPFEREEIQVRPMAATQILLLSVVAEW